MTDRNVTLICAAGDRATAEALAAEFPGGAGTFSVPLATAPGLTDLAQATHWAGSGYMDEDMVAAFDMSVAPMFKVFPMTDDLPDFASHIAACVPPLYRVYENEVV